jgi:hypothetical protein
MRLDELPERTRDSAPATPLSYPIEAIPDLTGIPRSKVFAAIRNKELRALKAGRSTIIEHPELVRYLASLPSKGRASDPSPMQAEVGAV